MAPACLLLGPPKIHGLPPPTAAAGGAEALVDAVVTQTHNLDLSEKPAALSAGNNSQPENESRDAGDPPMGLTENFAPTFLSSGNACLDFFFHVVPDTPPRDLMDRLEKAWDHDPLTSLWLIFNLRGVRGTGKSDKEGFYTAVLWLHSHHPKTLACNVRAIAEFGYFKDLLEILYRILEGPDVRKNQKEERRQQRKRKSRKKSSSRGKKCRGHECRMEESEEEAEEEDDDDEEKGENEEDGEQKENEDKGETKENESVDDKKRRKQKKAEEKDTKENESTDEEKKKTEEKDKKVNEPIDEEKKKAEEEEKKEKIMKKLEEQLKLDKERKVQARALRKERQAAMAKKALDKYNHDPNYQFLHDRISDLFSELLKSDMENLNSGKPNQISLAAKWCPTIDSSYDKSTLICEAIARKVFQRESYPEYQGIEEAHYVYRIRDRLRKQVLAPLHKALQLPEVFMSAKQWGSLPYNRVASVAMKTYKKQFINHDKERFEEYLEKVKSGKAKIAAGALLPHKIVAGLNDSDGGEVAELQWKRMVHDLKEKGKLTNCLAICDVSGSMFGTPMEVSVALGVLVSELSEEPWKGHLITFSSEPEMQFVEGDTLKAKTEFVSNMDWGFNTDFQKVFDRILEVAEEGKLREDQLIKRLFVFSDMEFDAASTVHIDDPETGGRTARGTWETDYEAIQRKFAEKGYSKVPEIVFWNLRHSGSTPVVAKQSGVAMVSGFSKNLLTMFLEGGGVVNPEQVMGLAISGEEYQKLVVVD